MGNNNEKAKTMIEKVKLGVKGHAKQAWNWAKQNKGKIGLGLLVLGGGAYLAYRGKNEQEQANENLYSGEPGECNADYVKERIAETFDQEVNPEEVEPYMGPTED